MKTDDQNRPSSVEPNEPDEPDESTLKIEESFEEETGDQAVDTTDADLEELFDIDDEEDVEPKKDPFKEDDKD